MFETIRDLTIAFLFTILTMVTMRVGLGPLPMDKEVPLLADVAAELTQDMMQ